MRRPIYILFLLLTVLAACKTKPAVRQKKYAFAQAAEPDTCEKGALADCVERGQALLGKGKVIESERYFQRACEGKEYAGCIALADISLKRRSTSHRKRAKAYLEKACAGDYYDACYRLGMETALDIPPRNRERFLEQACYGGSAISCGQLGERKEKYRTQLNQAQRFYSMACEGGLRQYCKKSVGKKGRVPPPKRRSREVFLRKFPSDKRRGTYFQVSAGPCGTSGCPFHLYLRGKGGVLNRQKLAWSSTAGPVERTGSRAVGAGFEDHYVGTFVKKVKLGPHLDGVEVMQEKGYTEVKHRSDIYLQIGEKVVQIPWTENGVRSKEAAPELLGVVIGMFDGQTEALNVKKELAGTPCEDEIIVYSTNYFPKQKAGKWLLGSLEIGTQQAFQKIEKWNECYQSLGAEVHRLF